MAVLGVLTIVTYGSWYYGFGVLLDDLRTSLHSSDRKLAYGFGLAQLLTGLLGVTAGRTLDRSGARAVFLVGGLLGGGLLAASSTADSVVIFSGLFGTAGGVIGATGFYAMTQSVAARLAPGREPASIARLTIWGAFASPLFIPATGLINRWWGWRAVLRIDAALVALAFLAAAVTVDRLGDTRSPHPSVSPIAAVRLALHDATVRRLAASACFATTAVSILLVYQVSLLVAAGTGAALASTLAGARGFAQLLGRVPLSRVVDRFGVRPSLRGARLALAAGCLLVIISGHIVIAGVYVLVAGASIGAMSPLDGIYGRQSLPPADLGTLMGALALLTGAVGAAGPILAATLVDSTGHRSSAAIMAAVAAAISALILSGRGVDKMSPIVHSTTIDSMAIE